MVVNHSEDEAQAFSKRLLIAMEHAGMPIDRSLRGSVAKRYGVSRESARKWLSGESIPKTERCMQLARDCGVSAEWLLTGKGYMEQPDSGDAVNFRVPSTTPPERQSTSYGKVRHIPVIDYIEAGRPREVVDAYEMGDGWRTATLEGAVVEWVGLHTFALEVAGDSMSPEFREGDTVVIDPDQAPRPGDIVVAKFDRDESATLKKYRERGFDADQHPIIELKPLNEDYAPVVMDSQNPGHVIGPVIEHRRLLRRPSGLSKNLSDSHQEGGGGVAIPDVVRLE